MKNRLNKGGLLILTQRNTSATSASPAITVGVNRRDFSRIYIRDYKDGIQTLHILDLFHSETRIESNKYEIVLRNLLADDYRRLLAAAGFGEITVYGDLDMNEYKDTSRKYSSCYFPCCLA
jgi:hypothetical protein